MHVEALYRHTANADKRARVLRIQKEKAPSAQMHVEALDLERMTGIGPAYSAWEADILPLNYIRGFPTAVGKIKTPTSGVLELMMGLEPMTC